MNTARDCLGHQPGCTRAADKHRVWAGAASPDAKTHSGMGQPATSSRHSAQLGLEHPGAKRVVSMPDPPLLSLSAPCGWTHRVPDLLTVSGRGPWGPQGRLIPALSVRSIGGLGQVEEVVALVTSEPDLVQPPQHVQQRRPWLQPRMLVGVPVVGGMRGHCLPDKWTPMPTIPHTAASNSDPSQGAAKALAGHMGYMGQHRGPGSRGQGRDQPTCSPEL